MPTVDPELLEPLSRISDILLKRPGKVSISAIKRLSNIYGFETFTDTLTVNQTGEDGKKNLVYALGTRAGTPMSGSEGPVVDRLSISGKILLIDIDFLGGAVKNVSISTAIKLQPIEGETYDFVAGWGGSEPVEKILLRNLQGATLDQFNKNLRILSQFDRLSGPSPNDLFNLFNQLTYNLKNVGQFERKKYEESQPKEECGLTRAEVLKDYEDGFSSIGKILMNQQNKIGLFLRVWQDNRYVNRRIAGSQNEGEVYVHFKITENVASSEQREAPTSDQKVCWFDNGDWLINQNDTALKANLELLVLEVCPSVWIPEDLLMELGLSQYEVRGTENDFFSNNEQEQNDAKMDEFYQTINKDHQAYLGQTKIVCLLGCPMVKIFKIQFPHIDRLVSFLDRLRSWCLVNSILRNLKGFSHPMITVQDLSEQICLTFANTTLRISHGRVYSSNETAARIVAKTERLQKV